jgi:hypothetical protein
MPRSRVQPRIFSARENGPPSARENRFASSTRDGVSLSDVPECSAPTRRAPLAARSDFEACSPVDVAMSCRRDVLLALVRFRWRSNRLDRSRPAPLRKRAERDTRRPSRRRDSACNGFALVRRGAEASWGQPGGVEIAVIASTHGDRQRRFGVLGE